MSLVLALALAGAPEVRRTDFGIRVPPGEASWFEPVRKRGKLLGAETRLGHFRLNAAVQLASAWGQVSSTHRTPEHNRRVGGARNSYHLSGRAIDVVRRPGVSHSSLDAALRRAGYVLVESLDEGDHSHFAFAGELTLTRGQEVASLKRSAASSTLR
jgi:hypothetical protein